MPAPEQPVVPNIEGLSPQAAAAFVKLTRSMANSPDMEEKLKFYDIAVKHDKTVVVPTDVQLEKYKREQAAKDSEREIATKQKETLAAQERARKSLIETGRYDEETVKKIEAEIMTPRGISDYETAAILYAHQHPEPETVGNKPTRGQSGLQWTMPWDGMAKDEKAAFISNPRSAARLQAEKVWNEERRKRSA